MRKPLIALVLITSSVWVAPAWCGFDEGMAAYRSRDYERAFKEFEIDALSGHDTAQFNLGVMYYRGEGVDKDLVKAFCWIDLATQRGDEDYIGAEEVLIMMLTPAQIQAGQALAIEVAAEHGLEYTPTPMEPMDARLAVIDRKE